MNTKEKRIAYFDLKGGDNFKPDMALLKEKAPDNEWCKKNILNPDKAQAEILFALLDYATKEEIVANRRKFTKASEKTEVEEKIDKGDGKEKTEIPADLEKVNEIVEENENLKEELEQKDDEISDFEIEKEELEEKNEELEKQLEAEKKNQPRKQDRANSKKNTNSRKSTGKGSKK